MIGFRCSGCGQTLQVKDEVAGKPARCPRCARVLTVPPSGSGTMPTSPPNGNGAARPPEAILVRTTPHGPAEEGPAGVPGYEILGELGRGGMGVVYKARHAKLKRLVALKMILSGEHAGEHELIRFRLEAEALGRLQHPNIVQIYEVGEYQGRPFFALEFVEGGNLAARVQGKALPAREAVELVELLGRAMHAAHQRGIVHRDLKPANVLLSAEGTPKVTDFGLAKQLDVTGQTASEEIMGTPSYMAPEQAQGGSKMVGPAADVYALGAILYNLLTGHPPFHGATPIETVMHVITREPVSPARLNRAVNRDLETICLKCLHKEPHRRYGSAEALADDCAAWLRGEPITARPVRRVERMARWARRRPALAAVGVLLVLLAGLLTLTGGATWLWRQAEVARGEAAQVRDRLAGEKEQTEGALREAEVARRREAEARKREVEARQQLDQILYLRRISLAYKCGLNSSPQQGKQPG